MANKMSPLLYLFLKTKWGREDRTLIHITKPCINKVIIADVKTHHQTRRKNKQKNLQVYDIFAKSNKSAPKTLEDGFFTVNA